MSRSAVIRAGRVCALVMGLLVLMFSVVSSVVTARDRQVAAQDGQLRVVLGQQVDSVESYFERSRAINALMAANPVFTDFYRAPGTNQQKIDAGGPLITRVNDALAYLEQLYPGRIGEACFIDDSGSEIARVVHGVPARPDELSQDEDSNAFFAATLAAGHGAVHQAERYESPDTHDQVISNSTVVSANGHTGIVHFEIALDSFRMPAAAGGIAASIIGAHTGNVIVDSRTPATSADSPDTTFVPLTRMEEADGVVTLGERRVAYHRLPMTAGNANHWLVAVSAPRVGGGWSRGLSVGSLALLAASLLTILVSGISWANHLRAVRRAASHDRLTGLPNRALLTERIEAATRSGQPAAVLVCDVERFREVNELLGEGTGDRLLVQVAERLSAAAPAGATVARLGSDDFALLRPGTADASLAAEQILNALRHTFTVDGLTLSLDIAAGIAYGPDHGSDATTLLRHADSAMTAAKQGFIGCQVYDPATEQHVPNRLALLGDLRRALASHDEIALHYQPKIDLKTGRLAGVEALIRWTHPELGRMAPDTFIPMAESTTLIHDLTARVLDIAVRQAVAWQEEGFRVPVAVNLSTRCLLDPALPGQVLDLLQRTGLPADLLELEITESMVMANPGRAVATLRELHEAGIRLSVDDFGTGHSSMAYLQQLPVDELKIDRSFVQGMAAGGADTILVRTAINLGHNLGLTVVAEGVETEQDVVVLRTLGCDIAQGYHFARPMPAADLRRWYSEFDSAGGAAGDDVLSSLRR